MAARRIWVYGIYGMAFLLTFGSAIAMNGQDGLPARADSVPAPSWWDTSLCLSTARAALARGELDEAEAWALLAENALPSFQDSGKGELSADTVQMWREIQAARTRELVSLMAEIERQEMKKSRETRKPELLFVVSEATVPKDAPSIRLRPESSWNKADMDNLVAYLHSNVNCYLHKTALPDPQATSEELLIKACSLFLQGNFQAARTLGLRARALDETKVIFPEFVAAKSVASAESKPAHVLTKEKSGPPTVSRQPGHSNEEESEPQTPGGKSSILQKLPNGWLFGLGIGTGVILVVLLRAKFTKEYCHK